MNKIVLRTATLVFTLILGSLSIAQPVSPEGMTQDDARVFRRQPGFLGQDAPNPADFLPPPPALESVDGRAEMQIYHDTRELNGTPRWDMAAADAEGGNDHVWEAFSCALGASIDAETAPLTSSLVQRTMADVGAIVGQQKNFYDKPRPFTLAEGETCVPAENLAANGSYPSGHSTVGWTWALLLAELVPERAGQIIGRGRAYAESRVVCGVHYPSDIIAGQTVATTVIMALQGNREFSEAVAAARVELRSLLAAAPAPARERCDAEAELVRNRPW